MTARQMAAASAELDYGDSEFELVALTPVASRKVKPPRVAESPVAFECVTTQVIRTNPGAPLAGNVVLGEVVWIHVDDELLNERRHVDPAAVRIGEELAVVRDAPPAVGEVLAQAGVGGGDPGPARAAHRASSA